MRTLFFIALISVVTSCTLMRSGQKTWDATSYKNNSNSQLVAAERALTRISLKSDEHILDIGSGDGKITAKIAETVKDGEVLGVDLSTTMVDFARANHDKKNLNFMSMDAKHLNFVNRFDTVVSFSTMQWVSDQQLAFDGIFRALKSNGRFLMTIPAGYPEPLEKALFEMMNDPMWKNYFQTFQRGQIFHDKDQYSLMLRKSGFAYVEVELMPAFDRFDSKEAFSNFVRQWLPHLTPIPKDQQDQFMNQLMERYLVYLPAEADGSVWFNKYSLEALAIRS